MIDFAEMRYFLLILTVNFVSSSPVNVFELTRYNPCDLDAINFDKVTDKLWEARIGISLDQETVNREIEVMFKQEVKIYAPITNSNLSVNDGDRSFKIDLTGVLPESPAFYVFAHVPAVTSLRYNDMTFNFDDCKEALSGHAFTRYPRNILSNIFGIPQSTTEPSQSSSASTVKYEKDEFDEFLDLILHRAAGKGSSQSPDNGQKTVNNTGSEKHFSPGSDLSSNSPGGSSGGDSGNGSNGSSGGSGDSTRRPGWGSERDGANEFGDCSGGACGGSSGPGDSSGRPGWGSEGVNGNESGGGFSRPRWDFEGNRGDGSGGRSSRYDDGSNRPDRGYGGDSGNESGGRYSRPREGFGDERGGGSGGRSSGYSGGSSRPYWGFGENSGGESPRPGWSSGGGSDGGSGSGFNGPDGGSARNSGSESPRPGWSSGGGSVDGSSGRYGGDGGYPGGWGYVFVPHLAQLPVYPGVQFICYPVGEYRQMV